MIRIVPTTKWTRLLMPVPRGGVVRRASLLSLNDRTAEWLVSNGYAIKLDDDTATVQAPYVHSSLESPSAEEIAAAVEEPVQDAVADVQLKLQSEIVNFFNTTEAEDIISAIKGIGIKTAKDLVQSRPLDWDIVQTILNDRQMDSAIAWANNQ